MNRVVFAIAQTIYDIKNSILAAREKSWSELNSFFHTDFDVGRVITRNRKSSATAQLSEYRSLIYIILTTISGRASTIPCQVYIDMKNGDKKKILNHQLVDLLYKPNKFLSGKELFIYTQTQLDLTGKAFLWKVRNGLAKTAELWPLDTGNFYKFESGKSNKDFITGFTFHDPNNGNKLVTYPASEIIYFRYPHPSDLREGCSPVQAMNRMIDIEEYVEIYERDFFERGAEPGLILTSTSTNNNPRFAKEARERILEEWKSKHQGPFKKHEPTILQDMEATLLNITNRDFEFLNLVGWTADNLFAAFSIPKGKLYPREINRANGLQIEITFNQDCIKPRLDLWDEKITNNLAREYDDRLYVEHDNPIPVDKEFGLKRDESDIKNFINTINEVRKRRGEPPVEWGDEPWGSFNLIQLGGGKEPKVDNNNLENEEDNAKAEASNKDIPAFLAKNNGPERNRFLDTKQKRVNYWKKFDRRQENLSKPFVKDVRKLFSDQEKEVLQNLNRVMPRLESMFAGWSERRITLEIKQNQRLINEIVFDKKPWEDKFRKTGQQHIESTTVVAGKEMILDLEVDIGFDVKNPHAEKFIKERSLMQAKSINKTTLTKLRKTLGEGFSKGETLPLMRRRVMDVYGEANKYRAMMIARTEVISANNFGNWEGMRQSKVVEKKEWLSSQDDRVRDAHETIDGTVVGINELFDVADGAVQYPQSVNERCTCVVRVCRFFLQYEFKLLI